MCSPEFCSILRIPQPPPVPLLQAWPHSHVIMYKQSAGCSRRRCSTLKHCLFVLFVLIYAASDYLLLKTNYLSCRSISSPVIDQQRSCLPGFTKWLTFSMNQSFRSV
ncbi:hypothetical protein FKM82_018378 [Ascaphus truei]